MQTFPDQSLALLGCSTGHLDPLGWSRRRDIGCEQGLLGGFTRSFSVSEAKPTEAELLKGRLRLIQFLSRGLPCPN